MVGSDGKGVTSEERLEIKVAEGLAWGILKVVGARLKREEVAMLVSWHGRKLGGSNSHVRIQGWKLLGQTQALAGYLEAVDMENFF